MQWNRSCISHCSCKNKKIFTPKGTQITGDVPLIFSCWNGCLHMEVLNEFDRTNLSSVFTACFITWIKCLQFNCHNFAEHNKFIIVPTVYSIDSRLRKRGIKIKTPVFGQPVTFSRLVSNGSKHQYPLKSDDHYNSCIYHWCTYNILW